MASSGWLSGAQWRDLPDNFGPYTTCYNRFVRCDGLVSAADALASAHDAAVQMIDMSIVRVHQRAYVGYPTFGLGWRLYGLGEVCFIGTMFLQAEALHWRPFQSLSRAHRLPTPPQRTSFVTGS